MHEVFINYRNGDGDEAAAALNAELSARFGRDTVFFASKSIPPGELFSPKLIRAVRRCSVLLAVIGPGWAADPRLHDENDWVRREILEAFENGIPVYPILKGRWSERLKAEALPECLKRLADTQSPRLELRDGGADLKHIGDVLAEWVPDLKELDRRVSQPRSENANGSGNSAQGNHGPVFQGRDFTGDINASTNNTHVRGDYFPGNRGSIHTGTGNINQGTRVPGPRSFPVQEDDHDDAFHRLDGIGADEDDR